MKASLLTMILISLLSTSVFAAEKAAPNADPKMAEMMKAWQAYSTPGAPHKVLAPLAGKWKYTSKMWQTADSKPEESTGTATFAMILGGRFLENKFKGKAMGMPFEGFGLTGYNNLTNKYETLWIDNMATGMMHGTGSFDAATNTLKDSGEFSCPMTSSKTQTYHTDLKIIDKNNMTFTMSGPGMDGKEMKHMELTYKR